jgi:hypothetical protein
MAFRGKVVDLLKRIYTTPMSLEEKYPEMKKILDKVCGNGQGLGNKCSDQEACFATLLENEGWKNNQTGSLVDGIGYKYQAQGTQKALDFQLQNVVKGNITQLVNIDLKHSDEDSIFLNDGTFLRDVVYVISFTKKLPKVTGQRKLPREKVCTIALGQDIMTDRDRIALENRFNALKQMNSVKEELDSLSLYVRNANQYSCKKFTTEFNETAINRVLAWLESFSSPTEPEQHSLFV